MWIQSGPGYRKKWSRVPQKRRNVVHWKKTAQGTGITRIRHLGQKITKHRPCRKSGPAYRKNQEVGDYVKTRKCGRPRKKNPRRRRAFFYVDLIGVYQRLCSTDLLRKETPTFGAAGDADDRKAGYQKNVEIRQPGWKIIQAT